MLLFLPCFSASKQELSKTFHLQVRITVGMSPLLLEKNNTKGSLAGVALARKQSNKTLYLRARSYCETFVHFGSKRPREKPLLEQAAADLGSAKPQPHSPDLLGISLNFCFAPPLLITAGSRGLQGLSWQSNRFGLSFEPCLGWACNSHNSQEQQGARGTI